MTESSFFWSAGFTDFWLNECRSANLDASPASSDDHCTTGRRNPNTERNAARKSYLIQERYTSTSIMGNSATQVAMAPCRLLPVSIFLRPRMQRPWQPSPLVVAVAGCRRTPYVCLVGGAQVCLWLPWLCFTSAASWY